jgi:hypothetical protein
VRIPGLDPSMEKNQSQKPNKQGIPVITRHSGVELRGGCPGAQSRGSETGFSKEDDVYDGLEEYKDR